MQLEIIRQEQNIEVLRDALIVYSKSNEYQQQIIEKQKALITKLEGDKQSALFHIEKIQLLNRRLFGRSSDKRFNTEETKVDYNFELTNEKVEEEKSSVNKELAVEEVIHELPEAERICPNCESVLKEMKGQYEESEEITVIQRTFKKLIHKRQKYNCNCHSFIKTADMPDKLMEGGRYSVDFAIEVVVAKYLDHIPLERQVRIMGREGLNISSQVLWAQSQALSHYLKPVYHKLYDDVLSEEVLHIDETRWEMLWKNPERWQLWNLCNTRSVYYEAVDTRSGKQASSFLNDYGGIVVSDAFSGYKSASGKEGVKWKHAGCWSHARRKFIEIEHNYPSECKDILELIGNLFKTEQEAKSYEQLNELRQTRSTEIIKQIQTFLNTTKALPESGLDKAIKYSINNWPELTLFLTNAKIPLTNNAAERALRGPVVGRKNHYGSKSRLGAQAASILYSIMESCKINKVNAVEYLKRIIPIRLKKQQAPTPYEYAQNLKNQNSQN
jgi:transposase